jgi:hypothetical protein
MLIPKNWVLSNEVGELGNITAANFSILHNRITQKELLNTTLKYGNCVFINPHSIYLPIYISNIIKKNEFTNLSNCILTTQLVKELGVTETCAISSLHKYGPEPVIISGKRFTRFNDEFIELLSGKITAVVNEYEVNELLEEGSIEGFIKLTKSKYLTWYKMDIDY